MRILKFISYSFGNFANTIAYQIFGNRINFYYVNVVKSKPPIDSDAIKVMVGAALQSPDPEAAFARLAASAGLAGTELPSGMAFINEVLDPLPDELCNAFLVNYFNDLDV